MLNTTPFKRESVGAVHRVLRAETRGDHVMIDQMISRLDLARREDYGLFLNLHHCALQELKAEWRDEDVEDFRVMMRRLQNDLRVLGMAAIAQGQAAHKALTPGNRLGIAYVIRGSRLGTKVLRQRVPSRFATSYFDFVPTLSWAQFIQQLERAATQDNRPALDEIIHGARITFQVFSRLLTAALG